MKRTLIIGLCSILALPIFYSTIIFAEESTSTNPTTMTTANETEDSPKPDDKSLLERLEKRKTEHKTKLSTLEKTRIKSKCQASQGLVSSVKGRIKGIETSRTNVHKNIVEKLTTLSIKINNKGVDASELDDNIVTLQAKIDVFKTNLAAYKQSVIDLEAMDCKIDPDGFKASLEAARAAQAKVKSDSEDIKSYIKDVIKPLLKSLRAQIEANKQDSASEGSQ